MLASFLVLCSSAIQYITNQTYQIERYTYKMVAGDTISITLPGDFVLRITEGTLSASASAINQIDYMVWAKGWATVDATDSSTVVFSVFMIRDEYDVIATGKYSAEYPAEWFSSYRKGCIGLYTVDKAEYTLRYRMSPGDLIYVYGPIHNDVYGIYNSSSSIKIYENKFESEKLLFCMFSTSSDPPSLFEISKPYSFLDIFYIVISIIVGLFLLVASCSCCFCCCICCRKKGTVYNSSSGSNEIPRTQAQYSAPPPHMYSAPHYSQNAPSFGVPGSSSPMPPPQNQNMGYQVPPYSYGVINQNNQELKL